MATIKVKRSAVAGRIPATTDLELGEIAINTYDGVAYIKKNVSGTETVVSLGGNVELSQNLQNRYQYTATANQTTFAAVYLAPYVDVYLNGVRLLIGVEFTATNGTSIVLASGASAGNVIDIVAYTTYTANANYADLNSTHVTTALGFTPYNATNPSNFITQAQARGAISASGSLSYNSSTGVISYTTPTTSGITEDTNLYFTDARARAAVSAGTGLTYNSSTGVITNSITQYTDALARAAISVTGAGSYNSTTGVITVTGGVTSVAGRTGAIVLTNADVGLGSVEDKSSATIRGEITSSNVTAALGFTPYNATNPSNYITSADARSAISATGSLSYNSTTGVLSYTAPTAVSAFTNDSGYLTANQSISVTGDATGSGATAISLTLANSGVTAGTYTKTTVDAKGRVTSGSTLSASDIPALDASKITTGVFDAARLPSYVDDVLEYANLAGFPASGETGKIYVALDTNKTYRWSGSAYVYITSGAVDSVAGKTGVVTLTSNDVGLGSVENKSSATIRGEITSTNVTTALGFTPYNATNPSGYTNNTGTVTSVSGTGTVSGLTLTGSVTTNGSLTLGGTLSLTSANVTGALGFTPYNATNPSGYITGITSGMVTTALGFTPYNATNPAGYITSAALGSYLPLSGGTLTGSLGLHSTSGTNGFYNGTGDGASFTTYNFLLRGWNGMAFQNPTSGGTYPNSITGYLDFREGIINMKGGFRVNGSTVLYGDNYNLYAPTLAGGGASGTWNISISGNAATSTISNTTKGVGLTDPGIGAGGLWVTSASGLNIARNGTSYLGLDAANYNSYSPTLTGGNASGTWGINITGNAGTATKVTRKEVAGYLWDGTNLSIYWTKIGRVSGDASMMVSIYGSTDSNYSGAQLALATFKSFSGGSVSAQLDSLTANSLNANIAIDNSGDCWIYVSASWSSFVRYSIDEQYNCTIYSSPTQQITTPANSKVLGPGQGVRATSGNVTGASVYNTGSIVGDLTVRGSVSIASNTALHAGNYNSYSPTLTGTGASGTWGINITGNAATATSATDSTKLPLTGGTITGPTYISTGGNYPLQLISTQRYMLQIRNSNNSVNSGYGWWFATDTNFNFAMHADGLGDVLTLTRSGALTLNGNTALHAGNYNSYSPTLTGGNASGTWGISITGNAATATSATGANQLNSDTSSKASALQYWQLYGNSTLNPNGDWHWAIRMSHGDADTYYSATLAIPFGSDSLYFRRKTNGTNQSWISVLNSSNYNSYSPTLTGTGASGTWGINVTGTAGSISGFNNPTTAATANTIAYRDAAGDLTVRELVMNVAVQNFTPSSLVAIYPTTNQAVKVNATGARAFLDVPTRTGGDASGTWSITATSANKTNANAGYARVGYGMAPFYNWGGANAGAGAPSDSTYTTGIDVGSHPSDQAYGFQIASNMWNVGLWTRTYNSGFSGWVRLLDSSNYSSYALPLSGGNLSGNLTIAPVSSSWAEGLSFTMPSTSTWGGLRWRRERANSDGNWYVGFTALDSSDDLVFGANNGGSQIDNILRLTKAGVVTNNGNQILHAGNYTSYAWERSGSWKPASLSGTTRQVGIGSPDGGEFALSYSGGQTYAYVDGWFYQNEGQYRVLDTQNYSSYALPLSGGTMSGNLTMNGPGSSTSIIFGDSTKRINVEGYWMMFKGHENEGFRWQTAGQDGATYTTRMQLTSSALTMNGNTVLHASNYSSYAVPYSGGTLSGTWYFNTSAGATSGALAGPALQAYSTGNNAAWFSWHKAGHYAVNMGLDSDNVLRIGGWSASANRWQLDMSGNMTVAGNVTAYSDERLKKDWAPVSSDFVASLAKIKSGTYTRIDNDERQAGVSAQDFQKLLPETISADNEGTLSLAYGNAALVSAVELAKEVIDLRAQVAELRALIITLINKDLS